MRITTIVHKGLRLFYTRGDVSKLDSRLLPKLRSQIQFLDAMKNSDELRAWAHWKCTRLATDG